MTAPGELKMVKLGAGLFGAFLSLSLLKFGTPPIFEYMVTAPENGYEFLLGTPWPIVWGYWVLIAVGLVMVPTLRRPAGVPMWLMLLPGLWFGWQLLSGMSSVDRTVTGPTLRHFCACMGCYYLGLCSLSRLAAPKSLWGWLFPAFCFVLIVGFEQHFGGLEATRRYFYLYIYPTLKHVPTEYVQKMESNRIFGTQFYPNALAGCLMLLLPALLMAVWRAERLLSIGARVFVIGAIALASLACLVWSRSKGGWLLMLGEGIVALWWMPETGPRFRYVSRRVKRIATGVLLLAGIAGFIGKYAGFFQKGAKSVAARTDYWRAGLQSTLERPVFGSGPGTFSVPYARLKRPEAEMARLTHNDYLEQASDSGLPGFAAYTLFVVGGLAWTGRAVWKGRFKTGAVPATSLGGPAGSATDGQLFTVWLGLVTWFAQGLIEFGLYLPSPAWHAFALLGWLIGRCGASMDNSGSLR